MRVLGARKLATGTFGSKPDPFAEVKVMKGDKKILKTKTVEGSVMPIWKDAKDENKFFEDGFALDL